MNIMSKSSSDRIVWIDCEMTGLNLSADELVETAVVITDYDLNILDPGLSLVIKPNASALEHMDEFVQTMHETSGLLNEIPEGKSLAEAESAILEYVLSFVPQACPAPLAGNSIGTDRMFLAKYMPKLHDHLHYRNIDVSSFKEVLRHWYPRIYFNSPKKQTNHRALSDIYESIRELDYYRSCALKPAPGPTTEEARQIKAQICDKWSQNMY